MSEYYCTKCGADLDDQDGFDPYAGYWICTQCGQLLVDSDDSYSSRFENVGWFCDGCGAFLNNQSGFSDWDSTWTCTKCGYENNLSESEIYESEEAYRKSQGFNDDYEDEDDDDYEEDEDDDTYEEDEDEDTYEEDEDEEDDFSFYDYEEYQKRMREQEEERQEEERLQLEERLKREEEQRIRAEHRKEKLKRFWRTLVGKKQSVGMTSEQCKYMSYYEVVKALEKREFYNINTRIIEDLSIEEVSKEGFVEAVSINGTNIFGKDTLFPYSSNIEITYHLLKRQIPPMTSRRARKKNIEDVVYEFSHAGFVNIKREPIEDSWWRFFTKDGSVEYISIEGKSDFKKTGRIRINAQVCIYYHVKKRK